MNFFSKVGEKHYKCESAFGKDKVYYVLKKYCLDFEINSAIVIVDGAAFASNIERILVLFRQFPGKEFCLVAPESFEFLLLNIKEVGADRCILNETYNFCDIDIMQSKFPEYQFSLNDFQSWERFYKAYLGALMVKDKQLKYSKANLNAYYLKYKEQVILQIPELKNILTEKSEGMHIF